jgi:quercetin dioxygenase-like cupin family protein
MSFINLEQLPFVGMSYEFVGETQGAPFSAYIVKAGPGQGPPLHKHPYVEVAFTLEGRATITVGDEQREVKPGDIVLIPANTPHRFVNSGDTVLTKSTSTLVRDLSRRISRKIFALHPSALILHP